MGAFNNRKCFFLQILIVVMLISLMRGASVEMMPTVLPLVYMMMAGVEGSGATGLNCWFATACLPLK